ncbi:MAG: hypothetical protein ABEI77_09295 [Halorientalis sp.]
MGRIQIADHHGEQEFTTSRWEGRIQLQLEDDALQVVVSDRAPYTADDVEITESGTRSQPPLSGDGPMWVLYLPTILGVLALVVDKGGVFSQVAPSISWALTVGLYWCFFLFGVVGTLSLYADAATLRATDRSWQPNPWAYIEPAASSSVPSRQRSLVSRPGRGSRRSHTLGACSSSAVSSPSP